MAFGPYVINQPQYPDVNGLKPDFYALKLIVPGLYSGVFPVGLTAINYGDKLESGRLRGNAQFLLAKTPGKYSVEGVSLTMYMNDYYQSLLPFLGNLGLQQSLGAYEVAWGLDLTFSTANSPVVNSVQLGGVRIGSPKETHKEGQEALMVSIDMDEPFFLVRNGVVPAALTAAFWPTSST